MKHVQACLSPRKGESSFLHCGGPVKLVFMGGKHPKKPLSLPRRCWEARAGLFNPLTTVDALWLRQI